MVSKVTTDIYRISVPLPDNPLKAVNCWFIRGGDRDLLIDTGFRRPECRESLMAGLAELGADRERLSVLLTHVHSDHSGLAAEAAGENQHIYLGTADVEHMKKVMDGRSASTLHARFVSEGFPEEIVQRVETKNPARVYALRAMDERFTPLADGEVIHVGRYHLQTIFVPGHTPGNTMFWLEEQQIMFTGDHILFDITPNITAFAGVEDSLGNYLDSLRRVSRYPVKLALPGHREPGDYHQRIDALLEHHQKRIAEALDIVEWMPGLSAYEIASRMKWRIRAKNWEEFPENQKWYAVGECLSHLDYLRLRGRLCREQKNGIWYYFPQIETER